MLPQTPNELKALTLSAVNARNWGEAEFCLRSLWKAHPSVSLAAWTNRHFGAFNKDYYEEKKKVAILRTHTVEPAVQLLCGRAHCERKWLETYVSDFSSYAQEILQPSSALYAFQPDITFFSILTRSIAPELWTGFRNIDKSVIEHVIERVTQEISQFAFEFRRNSDSHLFIHTLETPPYPSMGISDANERFGQTEAIRRINQNMLQLVSPNSGVYLVDTDDLIRSVGISKWYDEPRWESIRMPTTLEALDCFSIRWLRSICAASRHQRKAIICDLDNTLWHGVLGEVGFEGIRLGVDGAGFPHRQLQEILLDLHHRGIILAICSKNNHDDAWKVISEHPDMRIHPHHIAATRINWDEKYVNILAIAKELNVGLDTLTFLDDNPVERHLVRKMLPQVRVLEVNSPAGLTSAIRDETGFERLFVHSEDQQRGRMYVEQRMRSDFLAESPSLEAYLTSLETVIEPVTITSVNLGRVAQLTQTTNQFNLTTKRYSAQQISALLNSPNHLCTAFRVRDRFGDNGIVSLVILRTHESEYELDTFLLSCRVIGRGIESAILSYIVGEITNKGGTSLIGTYSPTPRNSPCANFLESHGFNKQEPDAQWQLALPSNEVGVPQWISLQRSSSSDAIIG